MLFRWVGICTKKRSIGSQVHYDENKELTLSRTGDASLLEAVLMKAGDKDDGYAAKTSCRADPDGTVADEVSGDSTDPSVSGRVPRISSTSRLGLLPPL